jgi:hypothetical protein
VGSIRFESAQTHEAVQLPASVADLDAALAKMNADNLTHFFGLGMERGRNLQRAANCSKKKLENSGRPLSRPYWILVFWSVPAFFVLAQTLNLGLYAPLCRSTYWMAIVSKP